MMNARSVTLVFAGGGAALRPDVIERFDYSDGSRSDVHAIRASVEVDAEPFHGRFEAIVWPFDLSALRRAFAALQDETGRSGAFECAFLEGNLVLRAAAPESGALSLHIRATPNPDEDEYCEPADGVQLTFIIEARRADLPAWLASVDEAIERFPPDAPE
jgi:hypothetical protein